MEVIFAKTVKLGNRSYAKGKQEISDSLFYNVAFKALVKSGTVQIVPRDASRQRIQSANDMKALQKAKAVKAQKAIQSAHGASSAHSPQSSASGSVQTLPTPAKSTSAGVAVKASVLATPATAQGKKG